MQIFFKLLLFFSHLVDTFCALTSGIVPHTDPLCETATLHVSVRPLGWQKPFHIRRGENASERGEETENWYKTKIELPFSNEPFTEYPPFSEASLDPLWSRWCTFWSPAGRRRRRSRRKPRSLSWLQLSLLPADEKAKRRTAEKWELPHEEDLFLQPCLHPPVEEDEWLTQTEMFYLWNSMMCPEAGVFQILSISECFIILLLSIDTSPLLKCEGKNTSITHIFLTDLFWFCSLVTENFFRLSNKL